MNQFALENIINWVGWGPIAIFFIVATLVIYFLKNEEITSLKSRMEELENFTPDKVFERLITRHKEQSTELENLISNDVISQRNIQILSLELEKSQNDIKSLNKEIKAHKEGFEKAEKIGRDVLREVGNFLENSILTIKESGGTIVMFGPGKKVFLYGKRTRIIDSVTDTEYTGPNLPGEFKDYFFDFNTDVWKLK